MTFGDIGIPERTPKPREIGRTMMIDLGVPLLVQQDLLAMAGAHIDLAKIAIGTSCLLPDDYLRAKILAYAQSGVDAFPGGMLLEYAYAHRRSDEFFDACGAAGYRCVEVSDNYLELSQSEKRDLVRAARDAGLRVFAEVGRKDESTDAGELARDLDACVDAGAELVLVEAAELERPDVRARVVDAMRHVAPEHVMFELPGRWVPGTRFDTIPLSMRTLVDTLGPDVNIANVAPEDVLLLENFRRRLATNLDVG